MTLRGIVDFAQFLRQLTSLITYWYLLFTKKFNKYLRPQVRVVMRKKKDVVVDSFASCIEKRKQRERKVLE